MSQVTLEDPDQTLARLSGKPGVRQILILDRKTGTVVRSSGFIDAPVSDTNTSTSQQPQSLPSSPAQVRTSTTQSANSNDGGERKKRVSSAEEYAQMVWTFVKAADLAVSSVDNDDDLKLLRLRTRKSEIMILPDPRFLLVVVHDTPPTA